MNDFHDIEAFVASNQKIMAIKELRARTGLGLKDAKDAVEHFQAHGQWPAEVRRGAGAAVAAAPVPAQHPPAAHPLLAIEQLVTEGQIIGAIKELRALTAWGLRESKEAVDEYRARGTWPAGLVAVVGVPAGALASLAAQQAPPAPPRAAGPGSGPGPAPVLQALAAQLGHAPHVHLVVRARNAGHDGHLVVLRDRSCFVHQDRDRWIVDPVIAYEMVSHAEVGYGAPSVLYVSVGYLHERFELDTADAEAVLALFRVFAP